MRSAHASSLYSLKRGSPVQPSLFKRLGSFGPYVLIELIMPGGTLLALLLYLYRRRRVASGPARSTELTAQAGLARYATGFLIVALVACGRFAGAKPPLGESSRHGLFRGASNGQPAEQVAPPWALPQAA